MRRLFLVVMPFLISGCELAVASQALPGLFWPVGQPLTGSIADADTGLPIGNATVLCGLGSATTDNQGRFALYGALQADAISVSRAGYTSVTLQQGKVKDGIHLALSPLFPNQGSLVTRYAELQGRLAGLTDVAFSDGSIATASQEGDFLLPLRGGFPGSMYSGVLGYGKLEGGPMQGANPFYFTTFGFEFMDIPLFDSESAADEASMSHNPAVPATTMGDLTFQFSNLEDLTKVTAEATLDFGMRGSILVARSLASDQAVKLPLKTGMIYDFSGLACNETGTLKSLVSVTTNAPGNAVKFELLGLPKPIAPTGKVDATPIFSWNAVPGAISYTVKVYENASTYPKWVGTTSTNCITYPGFAYGDLNGGALNPSAKYHWSVTASDVGSGNSSPSAPLFRPYQKALRESSASGMEFTR